MVLSTAQSTIFEKIRNPGSSKHSAPLTEATVKALVLLAAEDLRVRVRLFPATSLPVAHLFDPRFDADVSCSTDYTAREMFEILCSEVDDGDTYVACLASLHKARLKYRRILSGQPFARMDQVGPRGLLQYGLMDNQALAALLVWRKWMYDLDNRAAQDTGYLVEPVIAGALGGMPQPAKGSPIKREKDGGKGRQVDCIKGGDAYEFKLRMTIAASGQGRWGEELSFPTDCHSSGYRPILIVLDPTFSTKGP